MKMLPTSAPKEYEGLVKLYAPSGYIQSVTAQLKAVVHMNSGNPHHKSGPSRVAEDAKMVLKVIAAVNPSPNLFNISSDQCAK